MFITRKCISRRTFLAAASGVTLALPFLDAMVPASDTARENARRARFSASGSSMSRMDRS